MKVTVGYIFLSLFFLCMGYTGGWNNFSAQRIIGRADGLTSVYCADSTGTLAKDYLYIKGLQLVREMQALALDTNYVRYVSNSEEINQLIAAIGNNDYGKPQRCFVVTRLEVALPMLYEMSEQTEKMISDRLVRAILSLLNGQTSATYLAASSLLFVDDVFLCPGVTENTLLLYQYEGHYHAMVLFLPAQDDIVQAYAGFVISPSLDTLHTADEVRCFFGKNLHMPAVNVSE